MRITGISCRRVEVSRRGGWLFVQVATDAGLTGLGEASQGGDDGAVAETIERHLAPWLAGKSPLDVEPYWQRFASLGASRVGATALSGVEQALWDLAGQAAGQPVWRLLGGRLRPRLWVYANINRSTWERSPEGFAANARRAVGAGFRAVKLAPFDDVPRLDTPEAFATIALGIDRVLAVREAVGPEVQVLVDCHCHFNAAWAVRVARRLEPARLYWYEDPLPRSDPEGLLRVRQSIEQPVAAGETFFGRRPFWDLFTRGAVDVAMPDVKHCGGILELRRIAALAEPAHVQVAPHNPSGPVALAATAHAVLGLPNFAILEHAFGEAEWREGLVDPPEAIVDGYYSPPEGPGLGLRLNPQGAGPV
ncbi:MAG TPA: mandelate racemase/muconate lactonizing enzyme family protein [Chloroflexota bacterium]|jgi:galactonate dehydratase|nr:mandelate racemase/muconate lactonizing enzyme family protein [Chloroflexota bacterium]